MMDSLGPRGLIRSVLLAAGGWTLLGFVFACPALMSAGGDWKRELLSSLAQWWSWGIVTPLIVAVDRRLPVSDKQIARRLFAHLPLSFVLTSFYIFVGAVVSASLGMMAWERVSLQVVTGAFRGMFLWSWLVYWLIVGGMLAQEYYERYLLGELRNERLERLSTESRLHALRLQLDPHFLFNALNTISSQVESNPKLARRMIEHLGDLLRQTLATKDRQEVPLGEELALLEHYLVIQRIRFGDRLRFEVRLDDDVRKALVPALVVQPIVENAIRHGISGRASGGQVEVLASAEWDSTFDSGAG